MKQNKDSGIQNDISYINIQIISQYSNLLSTNNKNFRPEYMYHQNNQYIVMWPTYILPVLALSR